MSERCIKDNEYYVMYKDEIVGIVGYTGEEYYMEITNFDLPWSKYPPVWGEFLKEGFDRPCVAKYVKEFVEEKVVPECRAQEILDIIGLDHYDPWEIIKYTKGATTDDYWWFAKPGDKYEDWHPRAAWGKGECFVNMFTVECEKEIPLTPEDIRNLGL